MGVWQEGQRLGGEATDSPAGTLATTTFRKDPISSPNTTATAIITGPTVPFLAVGPGQRSVRVSTDQGEATGCRKYGGWTFSSRESYT